MKWYAIWQYYLHYWDDNGYDALNEGDINISESLVDESKEDFLNRFVRERMPKEEFEDMADGIGNNKEIHLIALFYGGNVTILSEPNIYNECPYYRESCKNAERTRKERQIKREKEAEQKLLKQKEEQELKERQEYERLKIKFEGDV